MKRRAVLLGSVVVLAAASTGAALAQPAPAAITHRNVPVCAAPVAGAAACMSIRHDTYVNGHPVTNATVPSGYGARDIESAYGLPTANTSTPTSGPTVAIVDAYDDPNAAADLATYRSQMGLPPCGADCFKKVNQSGKVGSYPRANGGWAQEISLDLDMVSAACPTCHILLVEATSASFNNLATAVNTAANMGAVAISNSYGGSDQTELNSYNHPGIAITASTGDNGYGVESPASFDHVIAVGGTSLVKSGSTYSETAWSGAGSGCSTKNPKPVWQTSATLCPNGKANADVSAVADPQTGVAVYDSYRYQGMSGWLVFGGTSASSPIVASAYAVGGNHGQDYPAAWTWANGAQLHDIDSGSNGTCSTPVWCTSGGGWDGPTGLGTPNGTGAF
ncbi:MAG TPA: hypothetical protein VFT62_02635 [Mycobacteriales bacterium]|nr:hypothetical protein [Mycobacteriales bacterium]